jgi:uncharacterized membrane protein YeaQ/YmgE (transglycosylase-associated protein family)
MKLGLIDRVPPILRHLILLVVPALLAWLASDVVPALSGQGGWLAVVAGLLGQLLLVVTPLTRQYGVGQGRHQAVQL